MKHNILLELTKDEYYKEILESVQESDRNEFIEYIENLARSMDDACKKFDDIMGDAENLEIFIDELGGSLNRRSFKDNVGVQEGMWPITKKD